MAQDQDLKVVGGVAANKQHEHLHRATQRKVGEFRQHQVTSAVGSGSVTVPSRASTRTSSSQPHTSLRTQDAGAGFTPRQTLERSLYLITRRLVGMLLGCSRSEHAKDLEIAVLHQSAPNFI